MVKPLRMQIEMLNTSILYAETILGATNNPLIYRLTEEYLAGLKKYKKIIERQAEEEQQGQLEFIATLSKAITKDE